MSEPSDYRLDRIDDSTCPFESPWRPRPLRSAIEQEPPRAGAEPASCRGCTVPDQAAIWTSEHWRLRSKEQTSLPGTVILETRQHLDSFTDLSPSHLAEFGPLIAAIERCLLDLDRFSRVHVSRWGDGSAHFHVYLYPRPRGRLQLRGTFLAIWELLLPPAEDREIRKVEDVLAAGIRARYPDS